MERLHMSLNAQPDDIPHYELIEHKAPAWIKALPAQASSTLRAAFKAVPASLEQACLRHPEVTRALGREHEHYRAAVAAASKLFETLPDLDTFATQQLEAAIKQEFQLEIDVANTYLFDAVGYAHRRQLGAAKPQDFVRSLKHHALQNFEHASTEAGGMDVPTPRMRSVILDQRGYQNGPPFENVIAIEPTAFAALCRKLDIGGQYQALIDAIYYPAPLLQPGQSKTWETLLNAQAPVLDTLGQVELSAFRQNLHLAYLQAQVSQAAYDALLATSLDELDPAAPATFSFLRLWQTELNGMLLIQFRALPCVVLYTPHAVESTLQEYPSLEALFNHLRDSAQKDLTVITRHMPDAQKARLSTQLLDLLTPLTFTLKNAYERVPDPNAELPLVPRATSRPFQAELLYQNFTKLRDDARFHAVPTLAMDIKTFHDRLAYFESIALNALNIVGFLLPGIGLVVPGVAIAATVVNDLLLGSMILQMGHEVYEGIESWQHGERQQAYAYLLDVVENIVFLAVIEAGAGAVKAELKGDVAEPEPVLRDVTAPSFIEELLEVEMPDGSRRLWNPDLTPFEQDVPFEPGLQADDLGLYRHDGKLWLHLDGKRYSLKWKPENGTYHIEHPSKPFSYEPAVYHNGRGLWLHELDRPLQWPTQRLLRRLLDSQAASFSDEEAMRILEVSDTDAAALRRSLVENQKPPALLQDTLARFKLDQALRSMQSEPKALREAFETRYEQLYARPATVIAPLRRYPGLPAPIIDELLQHADGPTLRSLAEGKVEPQLAEEIRAYQQQVRLARAYEGLYLDAVRNWDADRLILQTLGQLPDWPADTRIELVRQGMLPADSMRIGDTSAEPAISIFSTHDGYIVLDSTPAHASEQLHDTLYSALAEVIPPSIRNTLGGTGTANASALKRLLRTRPPLARAELKALLRMQPVRPGYRSPMRLADGRLGYPMGGGNPVGNYIRRPTLIRMINQLALPQHMSQGAADILHTLERRGLNLRQINDDLLRLIRERNQLTLHLDAWQNTLPGAGNNIEAISLLRDQLMQCWYDHAPPFDSTVRPTLRLERVRLDTFPANLPAFLGQRITRLELIDHTYDHTMGVQRRTRSLARVLEQFPLLRSLEISHPVSEGGTTIRASQDVLLSIATSLHELESLDLTNQNLILSNQDFERLSAMPRLRRLTLDGNRVSPFAREQFGRLTLDHLSLDRMSLDSWPASLNQRALNQIGTVSLRHNRIRSLPDFLIGNEQSTLPHTVLSLEGNNLIDDQLLRILLSHENSPERIRFDRSAALSEQMRRYTEQREQLHEATYGWADASSSTAPLSPSAMAMRTRISMTLNAYWRSVERGSRSPLRLDNIALEHFPPQLPTFFYAQVRALSMERTSGTAGQLEALLQRFNAVEALSLGHHAQTSPTLVPALLNLPQLSYLSLHEMGLEIDSSLLATLGQLGSLRTLELAGNRLGEITEVPQSLRNLNRLDLSNMSISQWPTWVDALLPLELLNLSDNLLTVLPEHILNNPDTRAQVTSIALFDNPLTPETVDRARRSSATQRRFTFAFSPSDDAPPRGHLHDPLPIDSEDAPDLALWLLGTQDQNDAMRDAWQGLKQAGDARNLLTFVGRLQQAAPFRNGETRAAFAERVRLVLIRALVNQEDRTLFDQIAQEALVQPDTGEQTCHDGVLLVFQNLEFLIAGQRMLVETADTEQALYQELRRLYRMSRLDEIARENAGERDETEVRLAYRRESNAPLKLGVPNDNILFEAIADVSRDELTRAIEQVLHDQDGQDFLKYAVNNQEWVRYLRTFHADRFDSIEQAYQANVLDLPNHFPEDTAIEDLASEYDALLRRKTEQEQELIRELTLLANPDRI
jgi:Leucine-rich repeat (LRR) protein